MSISEKLADYEETIELLGRLKVGELKKLAQQNSIVLERKNWENKLVPAETKREIIDVLVDSEFREPDLVGLLDLSRLEKEELLNYMTVKELKGLAREHGVVLKKSSLHGTERATRKDDIIDLLESELSLPRIRRYSKKISLIQKKFRKQAATKLEARKQRKTRRKAKPVSLSDIKKHERFIKVLNTPHAMRILLALDTLNKPSAVHEIKDQINQIGDWPDSRQLRYVTRKLEDLNVVKQNHERKGSKPLYRFETTPDGKKFVKAFKKFLRELERQS